MLPVVLDISVSSLSVVHCSVIRVLRIRFRLKLVCAEIIRLCRFFGAVACVRIFSPGKRMILWLLVPGVRQRSSLWVTLMSVDRSSSIPVSVLIMWVLIMICFIVLQRQSDFKLWFFSPSEFKKTNSYQLKQTYLFIRGWPWMKWPLLGPCGLWAEQRRHTHTHTKKQLYYNAFSSQVTSPEHFLSLTFFFKLTMTENFEGHPSFWQIAIHTSVQLVAGCQIN